MRSADQNGLWDVQSLATLADAVPLLKVEDKVVLGLPLSAVLSQRLRLPTVEKQDFVEMVRIQVEKALPYSPDEITSDYEIIETNETESIVSALAVHNEKLSEIAEPLLSHGLIPSQITVYAAQRAATHAGEGHALLIYPEGESIVSAMTENGKLSLTRSFGSEPSELQMDLPQLALSAELQGISTSFPNILLDQSCLDLRPTLEQFFTSSPDLVGIEMPPAATQLNLLPESWRKRRAQLAGQAEWRRRLLWVGAGYAAIVALMFLYFLIVRFQIGHYERRIAADAPKVEFIKRTSDQWKVLAPAVDPNYYPIEVLLHLFESLPSRNVHITQYNQSARQISVDGEANSAALAYQFAEKVKKNAGLQKFQFVLNTPRILPNDHAQFRLEGKPR